MATAKKATKTTALAKTAGNAVGSVINWKDKYKDATDKARQQTAKAPAGGGKALSFRGGTITFQGKDLGQSISAVIVAVQYARDYYASDFNPSVLSNPDCYSFDGVTPHEKAENKQNPTCAGCKFDAYKSAKQGAGKGCKEGLKLAMLLPEKNWTEANVATADLATAKLSVLNAKDAKIHFEGVFEDYGPLFTVMHKVTCKPDPKRVLVNTFEVLDQLPDSLIEACEKRLTEAETILVQPYQIEQDGDKPKTAAAAGGRRRKF